MAVESSTLQIGDGGIHRTLHKTVQNYHERYCIGLDWVG
ncbi:hypothetical protein BVRB_6g127300 [Beta vulgaris subsp. vulgaris]|nr:hypothetical protein BVRB_6g127300 [Beta vulgaris subsp. vulgaris]